MNQAPRSLIAVIDDDPAVVSFLERLLSRSGYDCVVAHDRAEAEALTAGRRPALALVDIALPDANGWDLVPKLWPGLPFVIMTGALVDEESRRDAQLLGAKAIMQKPFTPDQLLSLLAGLLPASPAA